MQLSLKSLLLISAIALASRSSLVLADDATVTSDAADAAVEAKVEEAVVEATTTYGAEADATKECAAAADDGTCITSEEAAIPAEEENTKCPSRPHVIRCAEKYLDTNRNRALEREELESAMGSVSWIVRGLLKVIGSVDSIMNKCDADGDGKITIEQDMEATKETCLATCFKRNAFKRLFFPDCTE